jgi:hypothetical protein
VAGLNLHHEIRQVHAKPSQATHHLTGDAGGLGSGSLNRGEEPSWNFSDNYRGGQLKIANHLICSGVPRVHALLVALVACASGWLRGLQHADRAHGLLLSSLWTKPELGPR